MSSINSDSIKTDSNGNHENKPSHQEISVDPVGKTPNNHSPNNSNKSKDFDKLKLIYDIAMLLIISVDLIIIGVDLVLMSQFAAQTTEWLGMGEYLAYYIDNIHHPLRVLGGFFTIFLITELVARWLISIITKEHMRWFFFPFVRWYEVLGCFPQLRALRLLRAFFIGRKLYQMGYQVLPEKWISTGRFYFALILEELSDRVILTATDNIRQQFSTTVSKNGILEDLLSENRDAIKSVVETMLRQELMPKLQQLTNDPSIQQLSTHVGVAVEDALAKTPELRRYLKLIPIAGVLIEGQLHSIGQHIGENLVHSLAQRLSQPDFVDPIIANLSESIADIDLNNTELNNLILSIINDSLTTFEQQVKVQQWKHHQHLHL